VNVRIARDGAEIGECDWEDLEELVNEGQVLPTDHFWYEGMPDWRVLEHLITLEESESKPTVPLPPSDWEAREFTKPPPHPVEWETSEPVGPAPVVRRPSIAAVAIGCALLVAVITAFYLVVLFRSNPSETPRPAADRVSERTDAALRSKATSDLIAKLNSLPTVASPPLNAFYNEVTIAISDAPTPLTVRIRGRESIVDPTTRQVISHANFLLRADFRQQRWFFRDYHASVNDLVHGVTTEMGRDDQDRIPPAIVSLLGLEIKSN
jgi:hypothetical protein